MARITGNINSDRSDAVFFRVIEVLDLERRGVFSHQLDDVTRRTGCDQVVTTTTNLTAPHHAPENWMLTSHLGSP
ncbi:hypothetical protein [Xanthomonas arboricola]|uniref:hypothetical protein n=1 Tax=Xanthomonas arboricola TaxID=56448 RepID=UPI0011B0DEC6|nr:hypothetical protein [Xanthomonas arboricola]MBB3847839.1 hypothetical protein [Xanthomonas arboricola]